MIPLTPLEERTFMRHCTATCPFYEIADNDRTAWGIGQARLHALRSTDWGAQLLLAKLILLHPESADVFVLLTADRARGELQNIFAVGENYYAVKQRRSSMSLDALLIGRTLLYVGAVRYGATSYALVPTVGLREVKQRIQAVQSEDGRKTNCSQCGLLKTAYKQCTWCDFTPRGKKDERKIEDEPAPYVPSTTTASSTGGFFRAPELRAAEGGPSDEQTLRFWASARNNRREE